MANPEFVLEGNGDKVDSIVQGDGTPRLKAAGITVVVGGSDDDSATQLTTDFTMLAGHGYQAVAAGPTATALRGSATPCHRVTVSADVNNTATLYVGLTGVTADSDNDTGGHQLQPGEHWTFGIDDVSKVFIHGTAGEGASFAYEL